MIIQNSTNIIKFVLDNKIVELNLSNHPQLKPTTTILNFLRSLPNHKGVKEGCAEGDCGACTVVLGELNENNKISYKSVTSCIVFLPVIHGKQLITVENIAQIKDDKTILHPIQQAIIETNGSQCGYCTPGIIMSLFALYKNFNNPSREIVEDALTGNLCRCTGYKPVIDAAAKACTKNGIDHFTEKEPEIIKLLESINSNKQAISIVSKYQKYFRPLTLKQALILKEKNPSAILINGASDIAIKQTKNKEFLTEIIDISSIDELKYFSEDNNYFYFGTGLTLEKLKTISKNNLPPLYNILKIFGSLQIRNTATIGGNIGSASPIGDLLPLLFTYKSKIKLKSSKNERTIKIFEFIKGYRSTDIHTNEIITEVIIPKPQKGVIINSYKISKRKDLDISTVSAAFRIKFENNKIIKDIILAFGGMAETTKRATKTENFLLNKNWNRQNVEQAMSILYNEFEPISDARAEADSRKIACKNLLLKFWLDI